jgi:hypothetical protein
MTAAPMISDTVSRKMRMKLHASFIAAAGAICVLLASVTAAADGYTIAQASAANIANRAAQIRWDISNFRRIIEERHLTFPE